MASASLSIKTRIKKTLTDSNQNLITLLLHPILLAFSTLIHWPLSIKQSLILLHGQWDRYNGFTPLKALNTLFYRTQWININRYGRNNYSPILGLGKYSLSNFWHLSTISSYYYAHAGAATTLLGVLWMAFAHLIWLEVSPQPVWTIFVITLFFFSSTTYLMAFECQNYQILGWSWVPICLFGVLTQHYSISMGALILIAILNITTFVMLLPLLLIYALLHQDIAVLLSLVPGSLVIASKLIHPLLINKNFAVITGVLKLIGITRHTVRYQRSPKKISIANLYFLAIYMTSILLLWYGKNTPPILSIYALSLFFINHFVARFADKQSTILFFSLMTLVEAIISPPSYSIVLGMLVALNPLNRLLSNASTQWCSVRTYKPFDIRSTMDGLNNFLQTEPGNKILFAYKDPEDQYEKMFDNYRIIAEAILCVAASKGVHLFPDFHTIIETNYQGSPSFWGRETNEVIANVSKFSCQYVIIYQKAGTELEDKWLANFDLVSAYDWAIEAPDITNDFLIYQKVHLPKWFLLRIK